MSNASAQEVLRKFSQRWKTQPSRGADESTTSYRKYTLEPRNLSPSTEKSPPSLASLPSKILECILLHLSPLQIVKLRSICLRLCHIIDQPAAQYKLECDLSGVSSGPAGQSLELEGRIEVVKAWRRAGRNPPWQGQPTAVSLVYQEPAGACALMGSEYADVNPEDGDGFAFLRLPSASRGLSEKRWATEALPDWTEQYTFDYTQDLFLLPHRVEGTDKLSLKFFSCMTGQAHPRASRPSVHLELSQSMSLDEDNWSLRIAVFGCLVGLAVYFDDGGDISAELWVLDWTTGDIRLNIYNGTRESFVLRSFAFLDDHRVLLLINESYTIPDLVVVDCSENHVSNARTNAEAVLDDLASLILGLPYLSEDAITDSITLECNPNPRQMVEGELFKQNNTPPVILVAYRSPWDYDPERTFDLLIPARVITSRIEDRSIASRKSLLWPEWCAECRQVDGPERGTLFPLSRVCGSRYITIDKGNNADKNDGSPVEEICIYDFDSTLALRKDIAAGDTVVVAEPTVVDSSYEQGEPRARLSTGAPYRKVRTGVFVCGEIEVLIAEDGFVARNPGDLENYASLGIYTI